MTAKLIGLCGAARSGKDTVANILVEKHGFTKRAFAQPIYDMLQAGLGIHLIGKEGFPETCTDSLPYRIYVDDDNKQEVIKPFDVSLRNLAQTLGTEWGRHIINENLWVQLADAWYSQHRQSPIVFADVQFGNEAQFIIDHGGYIVEVVRHQEDYAAFRTHASETPILNDYIDTHINNSYDLCQLPSTVANMLRLYYD